VGWADETAAAAAAAAADHSGDGSDHSTVDGQAYGWSPGVGMRPPSDPAAVNRSLTAVDATAAIAAVREYCPSFPMHIRVPFGVSVKHGTKSVSSQRRFVVATDGTGAGAAEAAMGEPRLSSDGSSYLSRWPAVGVSWPRNTRYLDPEVVETLDELREEWGRQPRGR
jgi:hypothetical protein